MINVVLTHSALGLDSNIESWAEWLRGEGHAVITPDLYGGNTYDNLAAGVERAEAGDMREYAAEVRVVVNELDGPVVLMGFSLGAAVSQLAAFAGPGVAGLLLVGAALSPEWLGERPWPEGMRGQVHYAIDDRWVEHAEVTALSELAPAGALEVFEYPGQAHLFAFPNFADYEPLAADRLRGEVRRFLASFS